MATPKTYGLTHLAIAVKDVERTRRFYENVFDMQTMYFENGFLQLTTPGRKDIIVFEERKDRPIGETGGIVHFGFRLEDPKDIDEMANRVIAGGGIIIDKGEFIAGSPYFFFSDLDGYEVEVWYEVLK